MKDYIQVEPATHCIYCGKPLGIKGFDSQHDNCCVDCWRTVIKPTPCFSSTEALAFNDALKELKIKGAIK